MPIWGWNMWNDVLRWTQSSGNVVIFNILNYLFWFSCHFKLNLAIVPPCWYEKEKKTLMAHWKSAWSGNEQKNWLFSHVSRFCGYLCIGEIKTEFEFVFKTFAPIGEEIYFCGWKSNLNCLMAILRLCICDYFKRIISTVEHFSVSCDLLGLSPVG